MLCSPISITIAAHFFLFLSVLQPALLLSFHPRLHFTMLALCCSITVMSTPESSVDLPVLQSSIIKVHQLTVSMSTTQLTHTPLWYQNLIHKSKGLNHPAKRASVWQTAQTLQCNIVCAQKTHFKDTEIPSFKDKSFPHIFLAYSPEVKVRNSDGSQ